jgi:hypothetical protein
VANAFTERTAFRLPEPPLRLLLGKVALEVARQKLDRLRTDFETWEKVTLGCDLPEGENS